MDTNSKEKTKTPFKKKTDDSEITSVARGYKHCAVLSKLFFFVTQIKNFIKISSIVDIIFLSQ